MAVSTKKKGVAMMIMIMLVATQVECITPSQEFVSIEGVYEALCEYWCKLVCVNARITCDRLTGCMLDCVKDECKAPWKQKH